MTRMNVNSENTEGFNEVEPARFLSGKSDEATIARHAAQKLGDTLAFDEQGMVWRQHNGYIWQTVGESKVIDMLENLTYGHVDNITFRKLNGVMSLLQGKIGREFNSTPGLPMLTQVFDVDNKTWRDYKPTDNFTWQLPYDYEPAATCPTIEHWLNVSSSGRKQLLAFAKAMLIGFQEAEVYLEAIGEGGAGKSTYTNLLQALVGTENTVASSFARLKANKRFETAKFYGKRFLVFADEQKFVEEVDLFKKLTSASDRIPAELKNRNEAFDFRFKGLVVVTANQVLEATDKSTGLARRRVIVNFHRAEGEFTQRLLDFNDNGQPSGQVVSELPGFFNLLLGITREDIREALLPFGTTYKQAKLSTEPLWQWADAMLTYDREGSIPIGVPKMGSWTAVFDTHLYANYRSWMTARGEKAILAEKTFSPQLGELFEKHLKAPDIYRKGTRDGVKLFGVRFSKDGDEGVVTRYIVKDA